MRAMYKSEPEPSPRLMSQRLQTEQVSVVSLRRSAEQVSKN